MLQVKILKHLLSYSSMCEREARTKKAGVSEQNAKEKVRIYVFDET